MRNSQFICSKLFIILLALTLGLVAAAPFLTRPGLPHQTDAELHIYRAAELGHTLRDGAFYPRWAPDFYFGYGYPIFNYYAPLTYYLSNAFDLLPGMDIVGGVKMVFVLGLLIASLGSYLLASDLFGSEAGILAAAAFTFSPYVVFIDPHARGDLAEHFSLCLFPLAFYALRRLMNGVNRRGALLTSVLSLAAIVFSHNLMGLVAAVLLAAYWLWLVWFKKDHRAWWGGVVFFLAAAIIAFFWLPFLLERDAIKLEVIGPGHFDFREHFLSLGELLAPSRILDMGATAPHHRFNLGLAQWLLALPALGVILHRRAQRQAMELLYFVLASVGLIFVMLPVSGFVWERVPGMPYLQFPWRLLGAANVTLAVCIAGGATLLPAGRWRIGGTAAALAGILLLALPVLYPPPWSPDFGGTSAYDIIEWEQRSLALGTTSTGDFLPVKAARAPLHPMPTLIESYTQHGPIDKVNRAALPEGTRVEIINHGPLHDTFSISTPKPFTLRLYTFYFPGWRAYVDEEEVPIEIAHPEGFITLAIPAGEHRVEVRFEDTPPRTVGWIISSLGWVALVLTLLLMRSNSTKTANVQVQLPTITPQSIIWLSLILFSFMTLKAVIIDPHDNWLRYTSPPGQARAAQYEQRANFGGQIELLGFDLPHGRVRSGESLPVVLYWHAMVPQQVNYQTFLHLTQPPHILWGQEDHLHPAGLPTTQWPLDKYVWDEYDLPVLPGTPPGKYVLSAGLYSMTGGYRLERYDEKGQPVDTSVTLGTIEVTRPRRQPQLTDLNLTQEVAHNFSAGQVTLLGYVQSPSKQIVLPGTWSVALFWRAAVDHPIARVRDFVLWDANGQEKWRHSSPPVGGRYPFERWQRGEIIRDPIQLGPEESEVLSPGKYHFGVIVCTAEGSVNPQETIRLGTVEFIAQEGKETTDG